MADRESGEHSARQNVKHVQPDHGAPSFRRASLRSSRTSRAQWMTKARYGGGHRPQRQLRRRDRYSVLLQKTADQQDRADGDEDVLAEEERDVVDRGGIGADKIAGFLVERGVALGRRFRHRRDDGAHHLNGSAKRGEAERRSDLADGEIEDEDAARAGALQLADERAGALADAAALQEADHRQHQPSDGDEAIGDKRFAQHGDNHERREACRKAGHQSRERHHQERIDPQGEAQNDDGDARKNQHVLCPRRWRYWQVTGGLCKSLASFLPRLRGRWLAPISARDGGGGRHFFPPPPLRGPPPP